MSQSVADQVEDFGRHHPGGTFSIEIELDEWPNGTATVVLQPPAIRPPKMLTRGGKVRRKRR